MHSPVLSGSERCGLRPGKHRKPATTGRSGLLLQPRFPPRGLGLVGSALAKRAARKGHPCGLPGTAGGSAGLSFSPATSRPLEILGKLSQLSKPRFLICQMDTISSPCPEGCSAQETR